MRGMIILGFVLVILGLFAFVMPNTFTDSERDVIGNTTRTEVSTVSIPSWAGAASLVAGLVMIVAGAAARPRSY